MQILHSTFRTFLKPGIFSVMDKAVEFGFKPSDPSWINFGQGSPELGTIPEALPRIETLNITSQQHGYAPIAGIPELRTQIATLYNELFRTEKSQKFNYRNVFVSGGGRAVISKVIGSLGKVNLGYVTPDYPSYQGMMTVFNNVEPIEIPLRAENKFILDLDELEQSIKNNNISALLLSNPNNPTGQVIKGEQLKALVKLARNLNFILILDEFYFNYIYNENNTIPAFVSAASYIEDIENDPIIIISGITKALRYPGWRIAWALGSSKTIDNIINLASFLDGGVSQPIQTAILPIINKDAILQETIAIQKNYLEKKNLIVQTLKNMNLKITNEPNGAFYVWVDLNSCKKIDNGMDLLNIGLEQKLITIPGDFFDLNPTRQASEKKFKQYTRLSFGPSLETIKKGLVIMQNIFKTEL